ncbi:MAG: septal ring lytic transglycosylase RlpA family protein [Gammaproteobacteria bacterium]
MALFQAAVFSGCAITSDKLSAIDSASEKQLLNRNQAAYNKPYTVRGNTYYPLKSAFGYNEVGIASWYGAESGNRTAMGVRFDPHGFTAAHKTLPLPSWVRVTNLNNGRAGVLLVNDRGPFSKNRLIDLSQGAAEKIGMKGLAKVKVEYVENQSSAR